MGIFDQPRDISSLPEFSRLESPEEPTGSVMGAAFRQENIVVGALREGIATDFGYEPPFFPRPRSKYNAWADIAGTRYESQWDTFVGVTDAEETKRLKVKIDSEQRDRRILDNAGGGGIAAQLFAGLADAPTLIPGASGVRGASLGRSVGQNALRTAGVATGEAVAVEGALQGFQATRSAGESAMAIGGTVVLGAILGGATGAIIRKSDEGIEAFNRGAQALDGDDVEAGVGLDAGVRASEGVGADVVSINPEYEDFINPSRLAQKAIDLTPSGLTFGSTAIKAKSAVAQRYFLETVDTPYAFPGVDRLSLEPSVEVAQSVALDKARVGIGRSLREGYSAYRKDEGVSRLSAAFGRTGENLTEREFSERVGRALRREDFDEIPQVAEAARKLRDEVIEPLKDRAVKAGLLPEGVEVSTAASYFTRMWDAQVITQRSTEFKKRLTGHFDSEFRGLRAAGKDGFDVDDIEIRSNAELAAESVYNTLTNPGRMPDNLNLMVKTRGPMKERTLNVRDLDFEDFLVDDSEYVLNRYARVMTADIELKNRFDSADMERPLREISEDYSRLIDEAEKLPKAERGKRRTDLKEERDRVLDRLQASRDLLRGTYEIGTRSGIPYRVLQSAMTYNFIRALGGLVLSALPDVYRLAMTNGIGNTWDGALKPLMTNMKGYRLQARQGRELAGIAEVELNNRLMRIADVADPLSNQTPVERTLNFMGGAASHLSGGTLWNDMLKGMATQVTTQRLRRLSGSKSDDAFRQRLKLNKRDGESIRLALETHGVEVGGVFDPRVEKWPERARDIYSQVLRADADTVIVTPGVGDKVPGAEHHYWLKPALQFKSFAVAAHSRVMIAGLQEDQTRFLMSAASMASMGMFVYWVKAQSSGRETSDNPGTWLAEGVDRSGVFPLVMEANNWLEGFGAPGVYNILSMGEDEASRYAVRSTSGKILGPTAGLINDTATVLNRIMSQANPLASEDSKDVKTGDIGAARRLIPFGRHPGVKEYLDLWVVPQLKDVVK